MKPIKLRIGEIILIALTLASFALSIFYYPRLAVKTHPPLGNQDILKLDYSDLLETFGFSLFNLAVFLLYVIVPRLRTKPPNYKFKYYDRLMIWIFAFWLFGQYYKLRSEFVTLSFEQNFTQIKIFLGIATGSLFLLLGDMCSRLKPTWPISTNRWIRRNPQVLDQTITSMGWWLKAAGICALTQILLPLNFSIPATGACLLIVEFYMFVYPHYTRFRKRRKPTQQDDANTD